MRIDGACQQVYEREANAVNTATEDYQALGEREDERAGREALGIERTFLDVLLTDEKLFEEAAQRDELRDLAVANRAPKRLDTVADLPVLEVTWVHEDCSPALRLSMPRHPASLLCNVQSQLAQRVIVTNGRPCRHRKRDLVLQAHVRGRQYHRSVV